MSKVKKSEVATDETVTETVAETETETETTERRDSVSATDFLQAYIPGQKSGKTAKEIAEQLNMDTKSFSVKSTHLRKKLRLGLGTFKNGDETVGGEALAKSIKVPINDFILSDDEKSVEAWHRTKKDVDNVSRGTFEVVSLGFELPKLSGQGREAQPASELADLARTLMGE